jgi:hypothetical protein
MAGRRRRRTTRKPRWDGKGESIVSYLVLVPVLLPPAADTHNI